MSKKFYYFVEDLDVSGDNIPDGVLIRQLLIDSKGGYYKYTKNSYVSKEKLQEILEDIKSRSGIRNLKEILVSKATLNKIRNLNLPVDEVPRVVISKSSYFAHLLKGKQIDIMKLVKDLNKLFSK